MAGNEESQSLGKERLEMSFVGSAVIEFSSNLMVLGCARPDIPTPPSVSFCSISLPEPVASCSPTVMCVKHPAPESAFQQSPVLCGRVVASQLQLSPCSFL